MDTTTTEENQTTKKFTSPYKRLQIFLQTTRNHASSKIHLTWPPKQHSLHSLERNPKGITYNLPRLVETLDEHDDSKGLDTLYQDLLSLIKALEDLRENNPQNEQPKGTQKKLLRFRHFIQNLPENRGYGHLDTLKTALRLIGTALSTVSSDKQSAEDTATDPISKPIGNPRDGSENLDIGILRTPRIASLAGHLLAHLESALQPYANRSDVKDENHDIPIPEKDDVDENIGLPPPTPPQTRAPPRTPQRTRRSGTPTFLRRVILIAPQHILTALLHIL